MQYKIEIRIPLGKVFDKAQEVDDQINKSMEQFGFDEKVMTTSVFPFILTVPDDITKDDLTKCRQIVLDGFKEKFGFAEIESFVKA